MKGSEFVCSAVRRNRIQGDFTGETSIHHKFGGLNHEGVKHGTTS